MAHAIMVKKKKETAVMDVNDDLPRYIAHSPLIVVRSECSSMQRTFYTLPMFVVTGK
jgi:hypothetical protein